MYHKIPKKIPQDTFHAMHAYLWLWLIMSWFSFATCFRMHSLSPLIRFSASNAAKNGVRQSMALHMAVRGSGRINRYRRNLASMQMGDKKARERYLPYLRLKHTGPHAPKRSCHIPLSMRRKASERLEPLPEGENRLRKRQGVAVELRERERSRRNAQLSKQNQQNQRLVAGVDGDALETEEMEQEVDYGVNQEFKQEVIKARRQKNFAEIMEIVRRYEQAPDQDFNSTMAGYAIKLLVKLNETSLATQLLPIWHTHLASNCSVDVGIDVVQVGLMVKQFCKRWDMTTAVGICQQYGLDTGTWTFRYDNQNQFTSEQLAHHVLPDLFMGFCLKGDIRSALDVSRGMLEYGLELDDTAATTAMRQVLTMGTAEQVLRYIGTTRKQLRSADSAEELQLVAGRFASNTSFVKGCVSSQDMPSDLLPEVVFLGRSNVGKSSLLNALVGRKGVARTSRTPGKTQEFNYFLAGPHLVRTSTKFHTRTVDDIAASRSPEHAQYRRPFYMVDVPGVGYAKVSKLQRKGWFKQLSNYVSSRDTLQAVCHLVDSRVGPVEADIELIKLLKNLPEHVPYIAVLTKTDKSENRSKYQSLDTTLDQMKHHLTEAGVVTPKRHVALVPVSAKDKQGILDLWKIIIEKVVLEQKHEARINKKRAAREKRDTVKESASVESTQSIQQILAPVDEFSA